jgi:hypothetical protein
MGLYKATYKFEWLNPVRIEEVSLYILAHNFQNAAKLAETSDKITSSSGKPIIGNVGAALLKVEQIADDVCDFQNTARLTEIGSHMFSIVDKRLLKVELLAISTLQE